MGRNGKCKFMPQISWSACPSVARIRILIHLDPRSGSRSGSRSTLISVPGSESASESIDLDPTTSTNLPKMALWIIWFYMVGIEYTLLTYIVVYFRLEKKIILIEKSDPDPLDRSAEVLSLNWFNTSRKDSPWLWNQVFSFLSSLNWGHQMTSSYLFMA